MCIVQCIDNGSSRVVDEHFERSLGAEYSRLVNSPSRVSSVNDSSTAEAPRSGSVPANASGEWTDLLT